MSGLDAIRERAHAYAEHGTPGRYAPQDRARLLGAVERVFALHKRVLPVDESIESMTICDECERLWPCPTIAAMNNE